MWLARPVSGRRARTRPSSRWSACRRASAASRGRTSSAASPRCAAPPVVQKRVRRASMVLVPSADIPLGMLAGALGHISHRFKALGAALDELPSASLMTPLSWMSMQACTCLWAGGREAVQYHGARCGGVWAQGLPAVRHPNPDGARPGFCRYRRGLPHPARAGWHGHEQVPCASGAAAHRCLRLDIAVRPVHMLSHGCPAQPKCTAIWR